MDVWDWLGPLLLLVSFVLLFIAKKLYSLWKTSRMVNFLVLNLKHRTDLPKSDRKTCSAISYSKTVEFDTDFTLPGSICLNLLPADESKYQTLSTLNTQYERSRTHSLMSEFQEKPAEPTFTEKAFGLVSSMASSVINQPPSYNDSEFNGTWRLKETTGISSFQGEVLSEMPFAYLESIYHAQHENKIKLEDLQPIITLKLHDNSFTVMQQLVYNREHQVYGFMKHVWPTLLWQFFGYDPQTITFKYDVKYESDRQGTELQTTVNTGNGGPDRGTTTIMTRTGSSWLWTRSADHSRIIGKLFIDETSETLLVERHVEHENRLVEVTRLIGEDQQYTPYQCTRIFERV